MRLLERASFLRTLTEYAAEASRGDGRLVLMSGESGMGKTALLEALQRQEPAARWLWGACDGLFTPRPLGPLFDIAAQLDGTHDHGLAALCHQGCARDRLFDALLAELDGHAPTIVVIEDAHWADEATIDLLSFVGRRLARRPALVLVSYRDDELGDDHPLRRALGDLATQRTTRRMRLAPLSEDAVRTLAVGRDVDVPQLHRITGGNPFYVNEILEAGWPSIPPTVRDAVAARVTRLTIGGRAMAEVAAVLGARMDGSLMSALIADSDAAITECLNSGLLTTDTTGLRFRHELVRMAVEAGIAPHRKSELHARLLAALEQQNGVDPALLAHHAEGAADADAVLRHAPVAARRSSALGAHRESAAQYERALRFAGTFEPGPGLKSANLTEVADTYEGIAGEYSLLDRWEEAESALRVALRLRRELGDDRKVGRDLQLLATTLWRLCRGAESHRAAAEAVEVLLHGEPCRELGWACAYLGGSKWSVGQEADGIQLIRRAQDIGEHLDLPDLISYALNALGLGLVKRRGEDGVRYLERAVQIGLEADLPEAVGRAFGSLEEACISLQRFDEAERHYTEGMAFCDRRELGVFSACLMGWRTVALLLRGQWTEAEELCAAMQTKQGISPINLLNPIRVLGTIKGRRGDGEGWELLDQAATLGEATCEPQWIVPVRAARAELMWLANRPDLALGEARTGYEQGVGRVDPWTLAPAAIWLGRLEGRAAIRVDLPEPYALELAGRHGEAADAFEEIGQIYDAAMVRLHDTDEGALRQAASTFDDLGARVAATQVRRRMKELGIGNIPRGPRSGTRDAPAGLTAREQEVLALLTEGLSDKEISRRLVISDRTVHHHVSAILSKIGVTSRSAAVVKAARMGIGTPI